MQMRSWWCGLLATALLLAGAGCGGPDQPVKVNGVVKLDGKPLAGALVTFLPEGGAGRNATGTTSSDGAFQLTTLKPDDGALPGSYKVTVSYVEGVEAPPGADMKSAFEGYQKAAKQGLKKPPSVVIAPKFSDPGKTILKQKVPTDGPLNLDVTSK